MIGDGLAGQTDLLVYVSSVCYCLQVWLQETWHLEALAVPTHVCIHTDTDINIPINKSSF